MGLRNTIRRAVFETVEQRALPTGSALLAAGDVGDRTWAARSDSPAVGIDVALSHSAVFACTRLLADTVASLPVDVYGPDGGQLPTPAVLSEPAAGMSLPEWVEAVMRSLLLRGNAYGLITARTGPGLLPGQVELVHPDMVSVSQDPSSGVLTYRVGGRAYGRHDVWHARAFVMPGVALGLSPITTARQQIALGLAAQRFGAEYLASSGAPTVLIESTDPDLDEDSAGELRDEYVRAQRVRRPMVTGTNVTIKPLSITAEESQFLATQRASVQDVARIFGVPVEMVGGDSGSSMTYATVEGRALDFLRYSVAPWLTRLENALSRLLPVGHRVRFNADALLRSTTTDRYAAYKAALEARWLTVDEVRALEDLPPLPAAQAPAQDAPRPPLADRAGGDAVHTRDESDLFIYWTVGAGRARWTTAAEPLAALYGQLGKYMTEQKAAATALAWFEVGMGRAPKRDDGEVPDRPTEDGQGDQDTDTKGSVA